jgi:hypothetical protein
VWHVSPSTAKKLRGRIETILDFARAAGHRRGENPATWKGQLAWKIHGGLADVAQAFEMA